MFPTALAEISVDDLRARRDAQTGTLVLDVREPMEWAEGRIPGARHLPMSPLVERVDELRGAAQPVFVVCQSGSRSLRCAAFLSQQGIEAISVRGGTGSWARSGFPLER